MGRHTQKEVDLKKKTVLVIDKYVEDVKQDEKNVLDLLELIMRRTDPVKEESQRNLCKMTQFSPK